jgi:hypothetical protein
VVAARTRASPFHPDYLKQLCLIGGVGSFDQFQIIMKGTMTSIQPFLPASFAGPRSLPVFIFERTLPFLKGSITWSAINLSAALPQQHLHAYLECAKKLSQW